LRLHRSLLHPARRRAPTNGRVGLWNRSPLRSCTLARLLELFITGRLPDGVSYHRLQHRLFQTVISNVVINNVIAASMTATPPPPPPPERYVRHISICLAIDGVPFILLLFMLINASNMFDFHMLVVDVVMVNILELIMKIVPNYPTSNVELEKRKKNETSHESCLFI
jgi:hypothetical protein